MRRRCRACASGLPRGSDVRLAIASSSTERTASWLRSVMSRATPDDEYAAGIVSRANQPPFAKSKKSVHALTFRFMKLVSTTLSGDSVVGPSAEAPCAEIRVAATSDAASTARARERLALSGM